MIVTLRSMSPRGRRLLVRWTSFGTLGCVAFAQIVNWMLFQDLGHPALGRAVFSGTLIPFILATPLFFYLTLKLRELAIANHRLRDLASTDSLTQCLNRGAFTFGVDAWLQKMAGSGALLVIDADHFKRINDRFGHGCGDEALRRIADAIRGAIRSDDLLGRVGGEEFAVFLPGAVDAPTVAERIRRSVAAIAFAPASRPWPLTVSVGGATFARPVPFDDLFREADQRLYAAKREGRDRCVVGAIAPDAPPAGDGAEAVPA